MSVSMPMPSTRPRVGDRRALDHPPDAQATEKMRAEGLHAWYGTIAGAQEHRRSACSSGA